MANNGSASQTWAEASVEVVARSEERVNDLLVDAKDQALHIADKLGLMDTVADEYIAADVPDLARTIRFAESFGAVVHVSISVVHPKESDLE